MTKRNTFVETAPSWLMVLALIEEGIMGIIASDLDVFAHVAFIKTCRYLWCLLTATAKPLRDAVRKSQGRVIHIDRLVAIRFAIDPDRIASALLEHYNSLGAFEDNDAWAKGHCPFVVHDLVLTLDNQPLCASKGIFSKMGPNGPQFAVGEKRYTCANATPRKASRKDVVLMRRGPYGRLGRLIGIDGSDAIVKEESDFIAILPTSQVHPASVVKKGMELFDVLLQLRGGWAGVRPTEADWRVLSLQ